MGLAISEVFMLKGLRVFCRLTSNIGAGYREASTERITIERVRISEVFIFGPLLACIVDSPVLMRLAAGTPPQVCFLYWDPGWSVLADPRPVARLDRLTSSICRLQ